MRVRSALGSLQLPIAGFGLLVSGWSIRRALALPEPPAGSDGFVSGLASLALYALALIGFVVAALGFAIPPGDGFGVRFNRWQRRLFVGAAVAALLSVFAPLIAWSAVAATGLGFGVVAWSWIALLGCAVLALGGGLAWRVGEAVAVRR
ncbi:hypothetical protein BRC82_06555 [Halobacteriales archaeon QS_1_67_19]|nr:MAG: hypothetical protein BRC82_06555 [Halobacteriales archaeon QS_1_67_19]